MEEKPLGISRKLFLALANDQLTKRFRTLGVKAVGCSGCIEILMCDGPVSLDVCKALDELVGMGAVTGSKKIPWVRRRRKLWPVSKECLAAYGILKRKEEPG